MIHCHLTAYDDVSFGWWGNNRIVCYARTNRDELVTVRQRILGDHVALDPEWFHAALRSPVADRRKRRPAGALWLPRSGVRRVYAAGARAVVTEVTVGPGTLLVGWTSPTRRPLARQAERPSAGRSSP
jgi:hypothetical protein